jgi:hypothetical protein
MLSYTNKLLFSKACSEASLISCFPGVKPHHFSNLSYKTLILCYLCFFVKVFHCVHFECPADSTALASELEQRQLNAAVKSIFQSAGMMQQMDIDGVHRGIDEPLGMAAAAGLLPHMRLQGLGRSGSRDEGLGVDRGDGYGIGLLGGGSPELGP